VNGAVANQRGLKQLQEQEAEDKEGAKGKRLGVKLGQAALKL
jgi:hypothetical protein